jgi:hypothetical protein
MKPRHIILSLFTLISLICTSPACGQSSLIRVRPGVWDNANEIEVHMLLSYVFAQYQRNTPDITWPSIEVYREDNTPITLHRPGPENEVRIGLATHDHYWSQYSFQFSHELVHVLVGRTRNNLRWPPKSFPAGWFEESLCEVGSLFTLRSMALDWAHTPPFPGKFGYASALRSYAQDRIDAPEHAIPRGMSFREWYSRHPELLSRDSLSRELNTVAAKYMLPVFEEMPSGWNAVSYLRCGNVDPSESIDRVLRAWRDACPLKDQIFVNKLAIHLGFSLDDESEVEQTGGAYAP